jgi:hypothetical protein
MKKFTPLVLMLITLNVFAQSGEQTFTSSGTFTVPDGVTSVFIEVVGAGGSGGYNGTGGGGGGGYASGNYAVTPGGTLGVVIGVPGLGAISGTTSVGDFIAATGGENGVSVPNPEIGGGGAGGIGSGGNIANYTGGIGGGGYYTYFGGGGGGAAGALGNGGVGGNTIAWVGICLTPGGDGGVSGGLPGGNGGKGAGFTDAFCNVSDPAAPGLDFGGGGGGGNGNGGLPANGAPGFCKIKWCAVDVSTTLNDVTITANAIDASYQWIDCETGETIAGATTQTFTPDTTGSYAVIITDAFCADTSACVDVEIEIINIYEQTIKQIKVSPNPFTSHISVNGLNEINCTYSLINNMGQVIWSDNNLNHDFTSLPAGMYILKINNTNFEVNHMIVKQ